MKIKVSASWNDQLIERVRARLREAGKHVQEHEVHVGIPEADGSKPALNYSGKAGTATIAQVAWWQEFGAGDLLERPWFRSWFDSAAEEHRRDMTAAMRAEYAGNADAVPALARRWARELREWVAGGEAPLDPVALSVAEAREQAGLDADPPLFATGQLVNAIRGMVDGEVVG